MDADPGHVDAAFLLDERAVGSHQLKPRLQAALDQSGDGGAFFTAEQQAFLCAFQRDLGFFQLPALLLDLRIEHADLRLLLQLFRHQGRLLCCHQVGCRCHDLTGELWRFAAGLGQQAGSTGVQRQDLLLASILVGVELHIAQREQQFTGRHLLALLDQHRLDDAAFEVLDHLHLGGGHDAAFGAGHIVDLSNRNPGKQHHKKQGDAPQQQQRCTLDLALAGTAGDDGAGAFTGVGVDPFFETVLKKVGHDEGRCADVKGGA